MENHSLRSSGFGLKAKTLLEERPYVSFAVESYIWKSIVNFGAGKLFIEFSSWMEPFQGSDSRVLQPRVARSSQPWAEGRNPFGINKSERLAEASAKATL